MVQLRIISREILKPVSATPSHNKSYKLSLLDQLYAPFHVPVVHFYSNDGHHSPLEMSRRLKHSLCETLTRYYLFAGRLSDDGASVECNDEGVDYVEARMDCPISLILKHPDDETLIRRVFPCDYYWKASSKGCLHAIQITFFRCGGMAISVSMSHKIVDACSFATFINDWAALARQPGKHVTPFLITESMPSLSSYPINVPQRSIVDMKCVTRRCTFHASKIADLKAMAANNSNANDINPPTRSEVVLALIYKCASRSNYPGSFRPSALIQMVNMRPRLLQPLPKNSIGNFCWYYMILAENESELGLNGLVSQLRKGMAQLDEDVKNKTVNEWFITIIDSRKSAITLLDKIVVYKCSSLRQMSLYDVDFGWGTPKLVRFASGGVNNTIQLLETPDGEGIDAWVTLEEQDMAIFQRDKELLSFASLGPSASGIQARL